MPTLIVFGRRHCSFECSNVRKGRMFEWSNVQMVECSKGRMFEWSSLILFENKTKWDTAAFGYGRSELSPKISIFGKKQCICSFKCNIIRVVCVQLHFYQRMFPFKWEKTVFLSSKTCMASRSTGAIHTKKRSRGLLLQNHTSCSTLILGNCVFPTLLVLRLTLFTS
jgi:hypothetical protein